MKINIETCTPLIIYNYFFKRYKNGIYYDKFISFVKNNITYCDLHTNPNTHFGTNMSHLSNHINVDNVKIATSMYYLTIKNDFYNLSQKETEALKKCMSNYHSYV